MAERDEHGKKMFEPERISRRARGSKACRTAAAKRARRVFFPGPRSHFSAFGHQPGAFFWLSLFFCGKRKGRFWMHGPCSPVARTVLPAVFFGYKQRVYPGCRVENRVTPHSDAGSRKKNLTSKLAGILWIPRRSAG